MTCRLAGLALAALTAQAAIVSQNWREARLTLELDDGAAELEWISPVAFRVARSWGGPLPAAPALKHDPVLAALEDAGGNPRMRTRYLTVDLDHATLRIRVRNADAPVAEALLSQTDSGVELKLAPMQGVYGLGGGDSGRLNLSGEKITRANGFLFTSDGYGIFVRDPVRCWFDLEAGVIQATGARSFDFVFYFGPTPKEILEQHHTVFGQTEVKADVLALLDADRLPAQASLLPRQAITDWRGLAELVRTLNQWSLSAVLYPAFDAASAARAPDALQKRVADLAALLPIVYGAGGIDQATRRAFLPYLTTYLREAYDRGYPLLRPLLVQFPRDAGLESRSDLFLLGDELLLAPVTSPGERRRIDLPRGLWTDVRTNAEYRGSQSIEVDAPPGRVPMFARNGSLWPLAAAGKMELHYFPSLGGEFFLWEPELDDISQFHAAPAGDFLRVEIETKVRRTYEWILHHTKAPALVAEDSDAYQRVESYDQLKPGSWWHDAARNDLHILVRADADSDCILNISF